MFEVIEIGPLSKKRWFRRQYRAVKMKAVSSAHCEKLARTFEGYGKYTVQKYRAEFSEGEVITIQLTPANMLSVGDRMSVHMARAALEAARTG